nr:hypothetical protein [Candidatus Sigynarchaeota archaeon]
MLLTEDSLNTEIHAYLKANGVHVDSQVVLKLYGKNYKPDFYIQNGLRICGEGEWQKSIAKGLSQAAFYLDSNDVDVSFTIIYSNELESSIKDPDEKRKVVELLQEQKFHVYYRRRNMPSAHKLLLFSELSPFFKNGDLSTRSSSRNN